MKKTFWQIMKHNLWIGVGVFIGLGIVDWVKKNAFSWSELLTRIITVVVLYAVFSFVEYKCQK